MIGIFGGMEGRWGETDASKQCPLKGEYDE